MRASLRVLFKIIKMKKVLSLAVLVTASVLCSRSATAQMPYNVTTASQAYVSLTNATNISVNRLWSDTSQFVIPVGFSFQLGGATIGNLVLDQTNLFMPGATGVQSGFAMLGTSLQDRSYPSGNPVSPIQYATSGTTGSRILKLELKNAGFATEWDMFQTNDDSLDLQVWIYESNSAIEFHFGPSRVSHFNDYFDQNIPLGFFRNLDMTSFTFQKFYCLDGDPQSPGMDTLTNLNNPAGFDAYPASGTVYRFVPKNNTTGIDDKEGSLGKVYPVPASDVLYIESEADFYQIRSLTGSLLMEGVVSGRRQALSLASLTPGMHLLRLYKGDRSEVMKIIRQ